MRGCANSLVTMARVMSRRDFLCFLCSMPLRLDSYTYSVSPISDTFEK
jgi:hypothetical protein